MGETLITSDVIDFLKQVPPFKFMDEKMLKAVAKKVSMEFYPKGEAILTQAGAPSEYLYLIKKGGVKVFMRSGNEEVVLDYRSEGDSFGFISLYSGDKSRTNIVAVEDTICYLVDKDTFLTLRDADPTFAEYFYKSYLNKYSGKALIEVYEKDVLFHGGVSALPAITVGDIANKKIVAASPEISIRAAAKKMSENNVSSLVLVNSDGHPVGLITDRDVREKVVAEGLDVNAPVKDIMSTSLVSVQTSDYGFEATLKMIRHNIHHLVVMNNGDLKGMLTNHDLMVLRGTSPVTIAREIDSRDSVEELASISWDISNLVAMLIKEGIKASNIAKIITELNDRLVKKVIEIEIKKLGKPPVPYCWITYGSEGRKEQTFKTDQDNALVYEDPADKEQEVAAMYYFAALAEQVNNGLVKCGFPPCPAGYMASNSKWCQPLRVWKRYFSDWITQATPNDVLLSTIFFDFRPVEGDLSLAWALRDHLMDTLKDESFFLAQMASMITHARPPLGFFKTFVVEKSGEHKNQLNLKTSAIALLVDIARLSGLERGVREASTLDRLNALKGTSSLVEEYVSELEQSYEFIMLLRIVQQIEQIKKGQDPDNFIDPNKLSILEKQTLREIFQLISRVQELIEQRYRLGAVSR